MKIEFAIKKAFLDLKQKNIKTPLLDSEILMSKVLKKDRSNVLLNSDKIISNKDYKLFRKLISSRLRNKPIAYLTGEKSFWKYEFDVNDKVLIPRPETELIIEQVLKIYKNKSNISFLEVGVGSGCIILSILDERKNFYGTGIDLSKKCVNLSNRNADKIGVSNRVKFLKSDIDNFKNGKYDLIVSNPPYIKHANLKMLQKDVVNFEPKLALDGGFDGLSVIRKVTLKASELIKKNGVFALEFGFDQKKRVKNILINKGFYINKVLKDYANNDRCIISTKL